MAGWKGLAPAVKSTFAAKELVVIEPLMLVFLKMLTVPLKEFPTTNSGFPSPSMSPILTRHGSLPVVKSTFEAKELTVMEPEALVFLRTETVALLRFATTKSGLPSPSTSPMHNPDGFPPVVKSTFEAKELGVMEPVMLVFLKTETVLLP